MRAAILIVLVACAAPLPIRNDPARAKSFHCTRSDEQPQRSICYVDDITQCRAVQLGAKADGVFMSECVAQSWAFCALGRPEGKEQFFICTPDEKSCALRRDELHRADRNAGFCVRQNVGKR